MLTVVFQQDKKISTKVSHLPQFPKVHQCTSHWLTSFPVTLPLVAFLKRYSYLRSGVLHTFMLAFMVAQKPHNLSYRRLCKYKFQNGTGRKRIVAVQVKHLHSKQPSAPCVARPSHLAWQSASPSVGLKNYPPSSIRQKSSARRANK